MPKAASCRECARAKSEPGIIISQNQPQESTSITVRTPVAKKIFTYPSPRFNNVLACVKFQKSAPRITLPSKESHQTQIACIKFKYRQESA